MSRQPTTERGEAIVEAAREMADAAERAATAYEQGCVLTRSGAEDEAAAARAEIDRLVADFEDALSASEERARKAEQQASDAAALLIAAERELAEWKGAAMFAANAVHEADDTEQWDAVRFVLCAWADTAVEMGGADPLDKGPLDRERSGDANGEPAS